MRYVLVGATATMALLGAAAIGHAQAPDDKNKGPAAEGKAPAQQSPSKAEQAPNEPKGQPRAGAEGGKDQPKAAQQQPTTSPKSTDGQQKATQERTTDRPKGAEGPRGDMDKKQKSTEQQPADRSKDTTTRTENPDQGKDKDRQKATEQRPGDRDRTKATEGPQRDMDKKKSAQDGDRGKTKSAEQPKQGERVKVSEQQRSTVRERLTKTRVEKTRININVNIGTAVPRSVRLHTLPVAIVSIAPEYRGYSYIVLEDETIVIVNPRTYVIVDYIPVGTQRVERRGGTHLTLSTDQMRFVFRNVPKDRTAEVRARLALGAEVPRDVELLVFPRHVVQRIPAIDRYRYVVSGGEVIIVDPSDHEVILVIDE